MRKHFFTERVCRNWKRLPVEGLDALSESDTVQNLVSPEVVRQLDQMILVDPFPLHYSFYSSSLN